MIKTKRVFLVFEMIKCALRLRLYVVGNKEGNNADTFVVLSFMEQM